MSYKSASRHSTPPASTRSRPSPKPPARTPSPDPPLNFTLYGAPAPFTALRPRGSKSSRTAPPPPASPEDKLFTSSGVVVLKKSTNITSTSTEENTTEETPTLTLNNDVVPQESNLNDLKNENITSPKSPLPSFPSHRSVSPLDLSSLKNDDDDDVVESTTIKVETASSLSKSTRIDMLSGKSSSSCSSSIAPLSGCSTQTCTSLPRDDATDAAHHQDDANPRVESNRENRSFENSSVGTGSSPGHRRYILDRLESGYYSPDTVDVRFSVSEVIEAAEYANRLAELLDQALGRELGYEPADGDPPRSISITPSMQRNGEYRDANHAASLYEEERNKFFENVGGHPAFQNVIHKIELFESGNRVHRSGLTNGRVTRYFRGGLSVDKEDVGVPLPPPLPYEGFKTVHDEMCYCCGPRLFHFSADDLQRQRSMLRKVPVREKREIQEDQAGMNLQEILKSVISKRRDVVRPVEEPNNSVRSDWSESESCAHVDK